MRSLLVLSGPPGAGKSTIAKLVATGYDRGVHMHADDFWHYVVSGFVAPWLEGSEQQNAVVMSAIASAATRFVDGGYETVVDTVVGPWSLDPFRSVARECGTGLDYVVLRPTEEVAVRRATRRRAGLADEAVIRELHRQFADLGELKGHVIDNTSMTTEATATAIRAGLAEGKFRIS